MRQSYEQALVAQAGHHMLKNKANSLVISEVTKGCSPVLLPRPVALEPPFSPIRTTQDARRGCQGEIVYESLPTYESLVRCQVWISPEQIFNWNCCELFLKQVSQVSCRVGFEIAGNQNKIVITFLCHRSDMPVISTAFMGKFKLCKLLQDRTDLLAQMDLRSWESVRFRDYYPPLAYSLLLTRSEELHVSSYECLITSLANIPAPMIGIYQVMFQPVSPAHNWHRNIEILRDLEYFARMVNNLGIRSTPQQPPSLNLSNTAGELDSKAHNDKPFFAAALRMAIINGGDIACDYLQSLSVIGSLFQHGGRPLNYVTDVDYRGHLSCQQIRQMFVEGLTYRNGFLLNSAELVGLVHIPPTAIAEHLDVSLDTLETLTGSPGSLSEGTPIGICHVAGEEVTICIPEAKRHKHIHMMGKPGMGKSVQECLMILDDVKKGHGVALLDPHGDLADTILCHIPKEAVDRVVYFSPGDPDWVPIWNPMKGNPGQDCSCVSDNLLFCFKSFVQGWGDRMETILRHCFFGLLHLDRSSLMDVAHILRPDSDESKLLRQAIKENVQNLESLRFWANTFDNYRAEELNPGQNKLSKLLVGGTVSLMLSQPDSFINFHNIMDEGKIFIANLSGIGSSVRGILGSFLISLLHLSALNRSRMPVDQRKLFNIYLDEAHLFHTESLEDTIAETRKYNVGLTLAHQYMKQFESKKAGALGSVGTTILFNVDSKDASYMAKDFQGLVKAEDVVKLKEREAFVRCGTEIVKIRTIDAPPIPEKHFRDEIIANSRRRYCRPAAQVLQSLQSQGDRFYKPFTPMVPDTDRDLPPEEFVYEQY